MSYMSAMPPRQQRGRLSNPAVFALVGATAAIVCVLGAIFNNLASNSTPPNDDGVATVGAAQDTSAAPTPTQEVPVATSSSSVPTPSANAPTGEVVVPNGVGLDYQSAQDLWRAAGLHVLPAIDALGENRLPVIDSNWVVLAQDPPAGAVVPMDSFITATVKKYTDN